MEEDVTTYRGYDWKRQKLGEVEESRHAESLLDLWKGGLRVLGGVRTIHHIQKRQIHWP